MKTKTILIFLFFITFNMYAHKDVVIMKKFGNIKIATTTGFYYEEINKTLLIGEYAKLLADQMGFKDTITIFFNHNYISFADNCNIKKTKKGKDVRFFITYEKPSYDFVETLNLIEYIINNKSKTFKSNTYSEEIKTPSNLVTQVLSKRLYRPLVVPELKSSNNNSYYVENGKYYIYELVNGKEDLKLTLDNLYQITSIDSNSFMVFDTKKSFYYFETGNAVPTKRIEFENNEFYMPIVVKPSSKDSINIELSKFQSDRKIMNYNYATGVLN